MLNLSFYLRRRVSSFGNNRMEIRFLLFEVDFPLRVYAIEIVKKGVRTYGKKNRNRI